LAGVKIQIPPEGNHREKTVLLAVRAGRCGNLRATWLFNGDGHSNIYHCSRKYLDKKLTGAFSKLKLISPIVTISYGVGGNCRRTTVEFSAA